MTKCIVYGVDVTNKSRDLQVDYNNSPRYIFKIVHPVINSPSFCLKIIQYPVHTPTLLASMTPYANQLKNRL